MHRITLATCIAAAGLLSAVPTSTALACPFCDAPSLTLAEVVDQSDVVLLAEWAGGTEPQGEESGTTEYRILTVNKAPEGTFASGDRVSLVRYRPGRAGDLVLLTGTRARKLEWDPPTPMSKTVYQYVIGAPKPDLPWAKRLPYFVEYLEFPDQTIASDAYGEFANAPYDEIAKLSEIYPAERLRRWITSDETTPTRLGLYGLLLGLCGDAPDARAMEEIVFEPTTEFRLGIEGVMSGYLLLTGERGLKRIEDAKFLAEHLTDENGRTMRDDEGDPLPVPFSETYAAMQALRFLWQYTDAIPRDRLKQSMRLLVDRPNLADLVIADLARWKDWSVIGRLVKLYGTEGYEVGAVKRAIIRYLTAATRDVPKEPDAKLGPHIALAKAGLAELRKRDPETVEETEKFLRLLEGPPRTAPPRPE